MPKYGMIPVMIVRKNAAMLLLPFFFSLLTTLCADSLKEPHHVVPYRGMRMPYKGDIFYVTKIESEKERDDMIEIEMKFNMPVDPRTLQRHHILINDKPLPADALLYFNKTGDKIKILIKTTVIFAADREQNRPFQILLQEARSFNNMPLYHSRFDDLYCEKEYRFKFSNKSSKLQRNKPPTSQDEPCCGYLRFEEQDE